MTTMKFFRMALIGAAAFAAISGVARAGVYKWVDKDGHVKYGDRLPPDQAGSAQEVNRSAVPLALQERLKKLDPDFRIKRISGNLGIAAVCLEVFPNDRGDPRFVQEFATSKLGDIRKAADLAYGYETEYDEGGVARRNVKKADDRCPDRRNDRDNSATFRIYQLIFDPKAVSAYRTP
jgi:hypothetical protein